MLKHDSDGMVVAVFFGDGVEIEERVAKALEAICGFRKFRGEQEPYFEEEALKFLHFLIRQLSLCKNKRKYRAIIFSYNSEALLFRSLILK